MDKNSEFDSSSGYSQHPGCIALFKITLHWRLNISKIQNTVGCKAWDEVNLWWWFWAGAVVGSGGVCCDGGIVEFLNGETESSHPANLPTVEQQFILMINCLQCRGTRCS